jgi:L-fuculose-phosphate aldolase
MSLTQREACRRLVEMGRLLHRQGFVVATDGNISLKLDGNRILTTPSGLHKGFLEEDDLVLLDSEGRVIEGKRRASSEIKMHLYVYERRQDARAVVHAHPPYAVAASLAGISLAKCLLPEVVLSSGIIPTAGYATPTTIEVPRSIEGLIDTYDALILDRHGTLTVGGDLMEAYIQLEKLEHAAKITMLARQTGEVLRTLPPEEVETLLFLSGREAGKDDLCVECGACGKNFEDHSSEQISRIVSAEVEKALSEGYGIGKKGS